jgi:hypothetical protein
MKKKQKERTTFTCECCKGVFPSTKEGRDYALKEHYETFGGDCRENDRASLCDGCYQEFKLHWELMPGHEREAIETEARRKGILIPRKKSK